MRTFLARLTRSAAPAGAVTEYRFTPLHKLRVVMLGVALTALAFTAVAAVVHPTTGSAALRIAAIAATAVLAVRWIRAGRGGRAAAIGDACEPFALAVLLSVAPGEPLLALFGILLRALYGGPVPAAARVVAYAMALRGADLLHGTPLPGSSEGRVVGLVVGASLMQMLVAALHNYERSERRLHSVVQNSTDVITIVGADLRIAWQAHSVRGLLGVEPAELVGKRIAELAIGPDAAHLENSLAALGPGETQTLSLRLAAGDATAREVEAVLANRLHDGSVEGYVLHFRDATERHRLEQERVAIERLAERVRAEGEKQELEAQLQRSQRLESVGQLAGGIAHDFNNLLAVILNYAAFVRGELPDDSGLDEDLREIESAAERGARLTRQLLLFSQRKASAPEVIDLNALVDGLRGLLNRPIGEHVELLSEQHDDLWRIEADPSAIEQVLVNLVVNARDAVGEGGTVTISTANVVLEHDAAEPLSLAAGRYVRLTVADDGVGMDAETLRRALEPFYTTKPSGQGTGLGLATVDRIVTQCGGALSIASQPGRGTTVAAYLPVTDEPVDAPADDHEPEPMPVLAGATVLVVEDETAVRQMVVRILDGAGCRVRAASSGEEALELWGRTTEAIDLVLTDMVMPGMTGRALAERIREECPEQRILFMSGYSDELLERGAPLPADVLGKPFRADALVARVRGALDVGLSHAPGRPSAA